jgi:hypothetical protein
VTSTRATRPEAARVSFRPVTGARSFRPLRSTASATGVGPHRCTGESELHGSSAPTRYGTAVPKTSATSAVAPPEVEWKSAFTGRPSQSITWPFVACTAAVVRGCSPRTPP